MRLLVVQHLYAWSYQETVARVTDSVVLRWFCRVYFQHVPVATTVLRWAATIQPATLQALNDRVALLAKQARVTQGRKLDRQRALGRWGTRAHAAHPPSQTAGRHATRRGA